MLLLSPFKVVEIKVWKGTWSNSHSYYVRQLGFQPRWSGSWARALYYFLRENLLNWLISIREKCGLNVGWCNYKHFSGTNLKGKNMKYWILSWVIKLYFFWGSHLNLLLCKTAHVVFQCTHCLEWWISCIYYSLQLLTSSITWDC